MLEGENVANVVHFTDEMMVLIDSQKCDMAEQLAQLLAYEVEAEGVHVFLHAAPHVEQHNYLLRRELLKALAASLEEIAHLVITDSRLFSLPDQQPEKLRRHATLRFRTSGVRIYLKRHGKHVAVILKRLSVRERTIWLQTEID